jgi:3',5'-cyclic AMP phosphodiesterase CpdA
MSHFVPKLKRLCLRLLVFLLLAAIGGGGWLWWDYRQSHPAIREVPRQGGLDVTLWVVTDPHFGALPARSGQRPPGTPVTPLPGLRQVDRRMRSLAGTPWPAAIGGVVAPASALIMPGDLTEDGKRAEWAAYAGFYGLHPENPAQDRDGVPVLECHGNHDLHDTEGHGGTFVTQRIAARHGATHYGRDFGDLRVISLGAGPDHEVLDWLYRDLAATGRERPVILFMHYPLLGPWSGTWFGWNHTVTERFHDIVRRFNIVAILHGHYHAASRYTWRGIDVYNPGSAKHGCHSFGVIRVTDDTFTFGCWNTDLGGWWWWHSKPIHRTAAPIAGIASRKAAPRRPHIPNPIDQWCQADRKERAAREAAGRASQPAAGFPWLPWRRP